MHSIVSGFVPIWAVTALGWTAGRYRVLGDEAQTVLGRFAFAFAMPSLLFLTMSRSHVGRLATPAVGVFALSLLTVFAIGLLLSRRVFRHRPADQAIGAMCASYVNSANLGIPVAVNVLHDTSFIIAAALFQMLFITPVILTLMDLDTHDGDLRVRLLQLPFRNPVIAASAAGLAVAATGVRLPATVTAPLQTLGGAAIPSALFALGLSLTTRTRPSPDARTELRTLVALKTAAQPLLAYVLGRYVFALTGHALFAVVLCAGLPTAQNAFIFAAEYRLDSALPRDAVLLSTLVSMATLTLITYALA